MVDWLPPIASMLAAVAATSLAIRTYRLRKDLERVRDIATSTLGENLKLQVRNHELLAENAKLKDERIDPPNEYELAATYRSLGVEPPEELRKAEAERSKLLDDILADLEALDH